MNATIEAHCTVFAIKDGKQDTEVTKAARLQIMSLVKEDTLKKEETQHCDVFNSQETEELPASFVSLNAAAVITNTLFTCDYCNFESLHVSDLDQHLKAHTSAKLCEMFTCYMCWAQFLNHDKFKSHIKAQHGTETLCEYTVSNDNVSQQECRTKSYSEECAFLCHFCGEFLKDRHKIKIHNRLHTAKNVCSVCYRTFASKNNLRYHKIRWRH